ncbi:phosphoribosyl-ATP pyrophosphatase, partial [Bacillus cereus]|nr:phosphoribosyl-ATP pyrophosphatase [Bacillus cereus]
EKYIALEEVMREVKARTGKLSRVGDRRDIDTL